MNVSIIGTVGVPANYGGFESLVENIIGDNSSKTFIILFIAVVRITLKSFFLIRMQN